MCVPTCTQTRTHACTHAQSHACTRTHIPRLIDNQLNKICIFLLQLRVEAYDSSNPSQKATALVSISVSRNEYGPSFSQSTYAVEGPENVQLGVRVATVNATDKDGVSRLRTCMHAHASTQVLIPSTYLCHLL